jgi:hypothetical protein
MTPETVWISPEEAPNHTWGWVVWGAPNGDTGRMLALGARDGLLWRADGYAVPRHRNDWVPLRWSPLETPDVPEDI